MIACAKIWHKKPLTRIGPFVDHSFRQCDRHRLLLDHRQVLIFPHLDLPSEVQSSLYWVGCPRRGSANLLTAMTCPQMRSILSIVVPEVGFPPSIEPSRSAFAKARNSCFRSEWSSVCRPSFVSSVIWWWYGTKPKFLSPSAKVNLQTIHHCQNKDSTWI